MPKIQFTKPTKKARVAIDALSQPLQFGSVEQKKAIKKLNARTNAMRFALRNYREADELARMDYFELQRLIDQINETENR